MVDWRTHGFFLAVISTTTGCASWRAPNLAELLKQRKGQVYTLDWTVEERAALQACAVQGAPACVVRLNDATPALRPLSACRVGDLQYQFLSNSSKKPEKIDFRGRAAVATNFPLHGPSMSAQFGDLVSLRMDVVRVGSYNLPIVHASRADLLGSTFDACQGATHVIQSVTVGAFSLSRFQSTDGTIGVGVFSGAVQQKLQVVNGDGDIAGCSVGGAQAQGCNSTLSVTLIPLTGIVFPPQIDTPTCPAGTVAVRSEGGVQLCTPPGPPHVCVPTDLNDCVVQCRANNGSSCNTLGWHYEKGMVVPVDLKKAVEHYRIACMLGDDKGCANDAILSWQNGALGSRPLPELVRELNRTCEGVAPYACETLATMVPDLSAATIVARSLNISLPTGTTPLGRDRKYYLQRACSGGDPTACAALSVRGR